MRSVSRRGVFLLGLKMFLRKDGQVKDLPLSCLTRLGDTRSMQMHDFHD
jgi:hypothetical protein